MQSEYCHCHVMFKTLRYVVIALITYESFLFGVHGDHQDNQQAIGPPAGPCKARPKVIQGNAGPKGDQGSVGPKENQGNAG